MDNKKEMTWIKIDRDENGFATEECLKQMQESIPFVFVAIEQPRDLYASVGDEYDFNEYKESIRLGIYNIDSYLPIPKLEV